MRRVDPDERFVLKDFLPYLANRAGVKTGLVFGEDLHAFGVTLAEWRILIALWENENLRLNDVAEIIVADLSTTSRQVRGLEREGLIARARSRTDRRALDLVLTEKGRDLTSRLIPVAQMHERVATRGLTPSDLTVLRHCLQTIYENLISFETQS